MKRGRLVLFASIPACAISPSLAAGTKPVTLELISSQGALVLGGPVNIQYTVHNEGSAPEFVQAAHYSREDESGRFLILEVKGPDGKRIPPLHSASDLGSEPTILAPGETQKFSLDLSRYIHFSASGRYRIRLNYQLLNSGRKTVEMPVTLRQPTPDEAEQLVAEAEQQPHSSSYSPIVGLENMDQPVFTLPFRNRIDAGQTQFIDNLAAINTPEVTAALVGYLHNDSFINDRQMRTDGQISTFACAALLRRLPGYNPFPWSLQTGLTILEQKHFSERSGWKPYAPIIRTHALQVLSGQESNAWRTPLKILGLIGKQSEVPSVLKALDTALENCRTSVRETDHFDSISRMNAQFEPYAGENNLNAVVDCLTEMAKRHIAMPAIDTSPTAFLTHLSPKTGLNVKDATAYLAVSLALHDPRPVVQEMGLQTLVHSAAPSALPLIKAEKERITVLILSDDLQVRTVACRVAGLSGEKSLLPALLTVVQAARSREVVEASVTAAQKLGGGYEARVSVASRLDTPEFESTARNELGSLINSNRPIGLFFSHPHADIKHVRQTWLTFLEEHREAIETRHFFAKDDPEVPRELVHDAFDYSD